jgi:hypothetical protein
MFHIATILSKNYAITQEDAQKIYPQLAGILSNGQDVQLSFEGLENCSTIFLRHTLGALYLTFGAKVDELVHITGINPDDELLPLQLQKLKERALNKGSYQPIFEQAVGKA